MRWVGVMRRASGRVGRVILRMIPSRRVHAGLCRIMRAIQHAAETFCEGRRIQTLRAFRRTQGRPEGRCLSIFQNWKSQNVQNGSSESAASVTDGHQIGRKMRPNPVQIRGKNGKNRKKIAKHAHTDVKILACWVQGWFL